MQLIVSLFLLVGNHFILISIQIRCTRVVFYILSAEGVQTSPIHCMWAMFVEYRITKDCKDCKVHVTSTACNILQVDNAALLP